MFTILIQTIHRIGQWRWPAMCLLLCLVTAARAQGTFNSGSTGADGPFNPTQSQEVQLPESGVFNFTTVNIPAGVTITFKRNSRNTPVTILASGNVTIGGTIDVSGGKSTATEVGLGGPGGFNGGKGGSRFFPFDGISGEGPGGGGGGRGQDPNFGLGGSAGFSFNGNGGPNSFDGGRGLTYGTKTLLPLVGGSGGGGAGGANNGVGGNGAGGGGAILIAGSGAIIFGGASGRGTISARGGFPFICRAGSGSGGAIRLIANTITGMATLNVGVNEGCAYRAGSGYIRVESFDFSNFDLNAGDGVLSSGLPGPVTISNTPTLRVASVGGISTPATSLGSLQGTPDVTLPNTQTNPVTVTLQAANIPLNTTVQVRLIPPTGVPSNVQSTPLTGTVAASTATASLTLPPGQSLLYATASIDLTTSTAQLKPIFIEGERVRRIEVGASFGGASEAVYVTESGRRVKVE